MQPAKAILGGIVGATVMTVIAAILRGLGMPINLEMMLGSMITGATGGTTWVLGFIMHLIFGALFGLGYGALFEFVTHRAGWTQGLGIGVLHAVFSGLLLGLIPPLHPLIPETLPAPGIFMGRLGFGGVVVFTLLHLVFGAIVGAVYKPVKIEHRREAQVPAR